MKTFFSTVLIGSLMVASVLAQTTDMQSNQNSKTCTITTNYSRHSLCCYQNIDNKLQLSCHLDSIFLSPNIIMSDGNLIVKAERAHFSKEVYFINLKELRIGPEIIPQNFDSRMRTVSDILKRAPKVLESDGIYMPILENINPCMLPEHINLVLK